MDTKSYWWLSSLLTIIIVGMIAVIVQREKGSEMKEGMFLDYAPHFDLDVLVGHVNDFNKTGIIVFVAKEPKAAISFIAQNDKVPLDQHWVIIPQNADNLDYYLEVAEALNAEALYVETVFKEPLFEIPDNA